MKAGSFPTVYALLLAARRLGTRPRAVAGRLWRLIRARKDNPLVVYNAPTRSIARRGLFVALLLLEAGALLAFVTQKDYLAYDAAGDLLATSLIGAPLLSGLSLWLFGYRYRETSHLEELRLTSLTPAEAAFGAAWWPVCISFGLLLPFLMMEILLVWAGKGPWVAGLAWVETLGLAWAMATAFQVHWWFRRKNRLLAFIFGGTLYEAVLFCAAATVAMGLSFLREFTVFRSVGRGDLEIGIVLLVISPFAAAYFLFRAMRFSGRAFFSPIDPEFLAAVEWKANERLWLKEKDLRRGTLGRLFREVRPGCAADRVAVEVTALLLLLGAIAGYTRLPDNRWVGAARGAVGFNSLFAAVFYFTILSLLFRTRGRGGARLPALSGAVTNSVLPYLVLPLSLTILMAGLSFWASLEPGAWSRGEAIGMGIGWLVVLVFYVLVGVAVALALLPRGPRIWVGGLCLAWAAVVQFLPLFAMRPSPDYSTFFFSMERSVEFLYSLVFVGGIWLLAAGLSHLSQRLHEREFAGLPRHRITTAPPPSSP